MKITVDVDITPEEMRELLGWPNIKEFQQELMGKIHEQMQAGADGYDPASLMQPFISQSFDSITNMQKMMTGAMAGQSSKKDKSDE